MVLQDIHDIDMLVLAADCEQHAAHLQFQKRNLKPLKGQSHLGLTDFDVIGAVFSENAAPDGIVEVDDDAFHARATLHQYRVADALGERRNKGWRQRLLRLAPKPLIEPVALAVIGGLKLGIDYLDATLGGDFKQPRIDACHDGGKGLRLGRGMVAERTI